MRKCKICGVEKDESGFYNHKTGLKNSYYKSRCKDCINAKKRKVYASSDIQKESNRQRQAKGREERQDFVNEYRHPCIVCGEAEKACIDLHHLDPSTKYKNVAQLIVERANIEIIKKEIDKCVCLCANCHRKVHAELIDLSAYIPTT